MTENPLNITTDECIKFLHQFPDNLTENDHLKVKKCKSLFQDGTYREFLLGKLLEITAEKVESDKKLHLLSKERMKRLI